MKDYFERPALFDEARDVKGKNPEKKGGLPLVLELLIFVAVFLVVTIGELLLILPLSFIGMMTDEVCREAVLSGDIQQIVMAEALFMSGDGGALLNLFVTPVMIGLTFLFCKLIQKRKLRTLGFVKQRIVPEYLWGILWGMVLFSSAVLICIVTGSLRITGFSENFSLGIFLLFVIGFMIQGMAEEVLCRGYFMVSIARRQSLPIAIFVNSLFFAALHLGNTGITVLAFINLTLFGIFASILFIRRGSIWMVGAVHSVWNLVQGNFYGIRVSGMETQCTVFESELIGQSTIWNGGSFGLEGGLGVTIVYVIGIAILCITGRKKEQVKTENNNL